MGEKREMLSKKEIDGARNRFSGDGTGAANLITLMNYCHVNATHRCHLNFFRVGGYHSHLPPPKQKSWLTASHSTSTNTKEAARWRR